MLSSRTRASMSCGTAPEGGDERYSAPKHSPYFDMYEPNLETGVCIFVNRAVDYLQY